MATDLAAQLMTTDEFLKLADKEGVTRELTDGVLVEREMTTRSTITAAKSLPANRSCRGFASGCRSCSQHRHDVNHRV